MDREFIGDDNFDAMDISGLYFIAPLKRNSMIIDYSYDMRSFFMFRKRAIRYSAKKGGKYDLHLFEDLPIKANEENGCYARISEGKRINFFPVRTGKIAMLTNAD